MKSQLVLLNPNYNIGFHITKEKTLLRSLENVQDLPLRCYQIYIANARGFKKAELDIEDILAARVYLQEHFKSCYIHASLLYNLAGSVDGKKDQDLTFKMNRVGSALVHELDIGAALGYYNNKGGVVVHIGSCKMRSEGITLIAKTIEYVLTHKTPASKDFASKLKMKQNEFISSRRIILENAAGEGTKIGSTLQEIADIIKLVPTTLHHQIKVCIDTAHIFGAGQYTFQDKANVDNFFDDFEKIIGLDKLELIHLNDSKVDFGSKKDRHENLIKGKIWSDHVQGLAYFVFRLGSLKISMIGEPPAKSLGGKWDYQVLDELLGLEKEI